MNNIERRRKKRKLLPFLLGGAALLSAGAIIALVFILRGCGGKDPAPAPTEPPELTEVASAAPSPDVTETPENTAQPTAQVTAQLAFSPRPETEAPLPSEPVRVLEDQSSMLFDASIKTVYDALGRASVSIKGQLALTFVNNTDRTLYTVSLDVGAFGVSRALLGGAPANYTVSNGIFTVALVNELVPGNSVEIYTEFEASVPIDSGFTLPSLTYDSTFLLCASIDSDLTLRFTGCRAASERAGKELTYSVDSSVKKVSATVVH